MSVSELLNGILSDFRHILGDSLVGFYVHGSLAFGCFTWETGDIDFIAVVDRPPDQPQRVALIRSLLNRTPDAPPKGIEMSIVLESVCRNFIHPAPFELHFSNFHLDRCREDPDRFCAEMRGEDPDLALHFAVIHEAGQVLYGKPVAEVFAPVPRGAVLDSILSDLKDADILADPVYFALNLCRALAFQRENRLLSKAAGGQWALKNLPEPLHPVVRAALDGYVGSAATFSDGALLAFREHMLKQIFG